jgi:hypothetical protein
MFWKFEDQYDVHVMLSNWKNQNHRPCNNEISCLFYRLCIRVFILSLLVPFLCLTCESRNPLSELHLRAFKNRLLKKHSSVSYKIIKCCLGKAYFGGCKMYYILLKCKYLWFLYIYYGICFCFSFEHIMD